MNGDLKDTFFHFRDSNSQSRLPGPQVPPRVQPSNQVPAQNGSKAGAGAGGERMLSVSGKKKCSHCKEELGNVYIFASFSHTEKKPIWSQIPQAPNSPIIVEKLI